MCVVFFAKWHENVACNMKRVYFSVSLLKSQTKRVKGRTREKGGRLSNERYFRIWISLATFFSCLSPSFYLMTRIIELLSASGALCGIASAHVPHILTSCTAETVLTTENENLLSHTHRLAHRHIHNDDDNDNDDQAHAGQNVCFSPIDLDSVEHARNVCTWYKSKNAMKQFKRCE